MFYYNFKKPCVVNLELFTVVLLVQVTQEIDVFVSSLIL